MKLVCIVSGQDLVIDHDPLASLRMLLVRALELTGNRLSGNWELRTDLGTLLDQDENPEAYRMRDGWRLFISPSIGSGAADLPPEFVIDCGRCGRFVVARETSDASISACPRCLYPGRYMQAEEVVGGPGRTSVVIDLTNEAKAEMEKLPRFPRREWSGFYEKGVQYVRRAVG